MTRHESWLTTMNGSQASNCTCDANGPHLAGEEIHLTKPVDEWSEDTWNQEFPGLLEALEMEGADLEALWAGGFMVSGHLASIVNAVLANLPRHRR